MMHISLVQIAQEVNSNCSAKFDVQIENHIYFIHQIKILVWSGLKRFVRMHILCIQFANIEQKLRGTFVFEAFRLKYT